jgi:predicted small lipoprotein YifL
MFRQLILAAPLMALAACGPVDKPPASKAAAPAAGVVTRQDASGAVDRFTPYENGPLALDEFSVGPVMAQTEFSMEAIKPRFPKARVEGVFIREDGGSSKLLGVTVGQNGGEIEIQGNPGTTKVGDIRIGGGTPKGPRGETLMMKWADADMDYARCWMGKDRDVHAVICTQPGEPVLRYVFGVPGWSQDAMPPEAVLREKAVLREFLWRGGAPVQ